MAGIIKSKLEGLNPEIRASLDELVAMVMTDPTILKVTPKLDAEGNPVIGESGEPESDARVITRNLEAFIELLTEQKKLAKGVDESLAEADKAKVKAEAEATGADLVKNLEVNDVIEFEMGTGKGKKVFTRKVLKKGDKTVTVEFTDDYLCTTSATAPTGKKYIKFASIKNVRKAVKTEAA